MLSMSLITQATQMITRLLKEEWFSELDGGTTPSIFGKYPDEMTSRVTGGRLPTWTDE